MFVPFSKDLTIYRKTGKTFLDYDGLFKEPPIEEIVVFASVQPTSSNDMQALPEGRRTHRTVKVYTAEPLQMADQKLGTQADRFYYLGREFEVTAVAPYQSDLISHYKSLACEVETR